MGRDNPVDVIPPETKRLKTFRKAFGISQTEIATTLGVTQSNMSRIERGEYPMSIDMVKKLHEAYQLNYTWLFHGTGKMKSEAPEKRTITTDLKQVLLENEVLKEKVFQLEKDFRELHTAFYAFKYGAK